MPEIRHSRVIFEPEKPYFDATPHYRFGSLEYDVIACACAQEKNSIQAPDTRAAGILSITHVPKWEFLEFFTFRSFLFIFPVSIPTSMTGKPLWAPDILPSHYPNL